MHYIDIKMYLIDKKQEIQINMLIFNEGGMHFYLKKRIVSSTA
jgi:hypothetical protein